MYIKHPPNENARIDSTDRVFGISGGRPCVRTAFVVDTGGFGGGGLMRTGFPPDAGVRLGAHSAAIPICARAIVAFLHSEAVSYGLSRIRMGEWRTVLCDGWGDLVVARLIPRSVAIRQGATDGSHRVIRNRQRMGPSFSESLFVQREGAMRTVVGNF